MRNLEGRIVGRENVFMAMRAPRMASWGLLSVVGHQGASATHLNDTNRAL